MAVVGDDKTDMISGLRAGTAGKFTMMLFLPMPSAYHGMGL